MFFLFTMLVCMARPDTDQTSKRKINLVGGKSYAISIPIDIIRALHWNKGDNVQVRRKGKSIVIERLEV